jgi:hypothetical protein
MIIQRKMVIKAIAAISTSLNSAYELNVSYIIPRISVPKIEECNFTCGVKQKPIEGYINCDRLVTILKKRSLHLLVSDLRTHYFSRCSLHSASNASYFVNNISTIIFIGIFTGFMVYM